MPTEFGDPVAQQFPEIAVGFRELARYFAVAAYPPLSLAEQQTCAAIS